MKTETLSINVIKQEDIYANLKAGEIIAYPTDTIYGIGADIYNASAVEKLFETKERDYSKPVSLLYFSKAKVLEDFAHLSDYEKFFIKEFFPGPVTLILQAIDEKQFPFPFIKDGKVGIRVIDHPKLNALMQDYPNPITTTSINQTGERPAESPREILSYFPHQFSLIIDDGPTTNKVASTVIFLTPDNYKILRESAVSAIEIESKINSK